MTTLLMRGAVLSGPEEIPDSEVECWRCPVHYKLKLHARIKKAAVPDDTVLVRRKRPYTRVLHSWECA